MKIKKRVNPREPIKPIKPISATKSIKPIKTHSIRVKAVQEQGKGRVRAQWDQSKLREREA